jgi:tetratricopeptide (TPR) repeat protein
LRVFSVKIMLLLLLIAASVCRVGSAELYQETGQKLPALTLMSPLSAISLEALAADADAAYSAKSYPTAERLFTAILELDSDNRRALFRLGNVFQLRGDTDRALLFYRRASVSTEYSATLDEFGEKALLNIALIASEQARSAIAELEKRSGIEKHKAQFQSIVDDLAGSERQVSEHIRRFQRVSPPSFQVGHEEPSKDRWQPQLIAGNVGNVGRDKADLPEVTYLKVGTPKAKSKPLKIKAMDRR